MFNKIREFISQVIAEIKKVTWPSRQELIDSTWIVLISSIILGFYIAGVDVVLSKFVGLIIR